MDSTNNVLESVGAITVSGSELIEKLKELLAEYGLKVLAALLILIIGFWVAGLIKKGLVAIMSRGKVDHTLVAFVASLGHVTMKIFVIIAALEKLNVKTTSFIAILGAAGLAVGLALQGSLSNFASGVLMLIFKPFKVGDFVEGGGTTGAVREIGIFTTVIDTPDNKKTIVPNSKLMGDNIVNYTANESRRVDLTAGISYEDDIDAARAAISEVLKEIPQILETPAPDVFVSEMADSSVNFAVRPWCRPADYWAVYFAVTEAIKKKFDAKGISIPFPQRDVHLYEHKEG